MHKIAIANPEHAPYGRAAVAAMKHDGVYDKVSGKLVMGENISQTAQFVQSGSADIGLLALSLAVAPSLKEKGRYELVPTSDYPPIEQAAVIIKSSKKKETAKQFLAFIRTPPILSLMRDYGFTVPDGTAAAELESKRSRMNWSAIVLTLRLAVVVCTILLTIGTPIAYWLTYTRWRWKFLIESVVALPLVLPPTVLGFYVLVAMGPHSPIGSSTSRGGSRAAIYL